MTDNNSLDILVSFIIPCFNSSYSDLKRLLDKFHKTNLSSGGRRINTYEIILVDDGSTNKVCFNIYQEMVNKHLPIKYFYQENQGPSQARMSGIKLSNGKYICFIDSDDDINSDFLNVIYSSISNTDIVIFPYRFENQDGTKVTRVYKHTIHQIMLGLFFSTYKGISSFNGIEGWYGYLWRYLYKRNFLIENKIEFDTHLKSGEDICFMIKVFLFNPSYKYVETGYYTYRYNLNSLSRSATSIDEIYSRDEKLIEKLIELAKIAIKRQLLSNREFETSILSRIASLTYVFLQAAISQNIKYKIAKSYLIKYRYFIKQNKLKLKLDSNTKLAKRLFLILFYFKCFYLCYVTLKFL